MTKSLQERTFIFRTHRAGAFITVLPAVYGLYEVEMSYPRKSVRYGLIFTTETYLFNSLVAAIAFAKSLVTFRREWDA